MDLELNTTVQLAQNLLDHMIKTYDDPYGFGTMTTSIYDTAWVSMIPKKTEGNRTVWLFPQSFSFLLDRQLPGGGWPASTFIDGILDTAAALLSLCKHQENPYQIVLDEYEIAKRILLGESSLRVMLDEWQVERTHHVGFEILVPAMLDLLGGYGMEFNFAGRKYLCRRRDAKLSMLDLQQIENGPPHSILHSLEALRGRVDFDKMARHKVCGSIMASPSATAAYLMNASAWDVESEAYILYVMAHGAGQGNGSVPSAFPSTLFETTWVISSLLAGGIRKEDLGVERVDQAMKWVHQEFQDEDHHGLVGFAPQIQPDADDTAKAICCLNGTGIPASAASLINAFGQGKWFKTYPQELHASITTNCNALLALLSDQGAVKDHSPTITRVVRHLCKQWMSSEMRDKWNLSSYYTVMLLAQALNQTINFHTCGELPGDQDFCYEDLPLVLFQTLIYILQGQKPDGSWDQSSEATAYAMLGLGSFNEWSPARLLASEIQTALGRGRSYLTSNYNHGVTQPELLWIEKVTYGSRNISEAYIIAALHCSAAWSLKGKSPVLCSPSWEKAIAMGMSYRKLPLLEDTPNWLLTACAVEGALFRARLKRKCEQILGEDHKADGAHLAFIPFTWTMVTRLIGVGADTISPDVQFDMMAMSALLYTLDYHMEANIGIQNKETRQGIRDDIISDFDYLEAHSHLPGSQSMDSTLRGIIAYVWEHPKVQRASYSDRQQVLVEFRHLLLAHLAQLDDNESLRSTRNSGQLWNPNVYHSSLHSWLHTTSGHHTGGGAAFSFFICLISSGDTSHSSPLGSALTTPQAHYLAAKLSGSLRVLSRLQNDWGSIDRDRHEGNLNSVDFLYSMRTFSSCIHDSHATGDKYEQRDSASTSRPSPCPEQRITEPYTDPNPDTALLRSSAMEHIAALAEHEKKTVAMLFSELEDHAVVQPAVIKALRVFAAAVEIYGEIYMLKDHTPVYVERTQAIGGAGTEQKIESRHELGLNS